MKLDYNWFRESKIRGNIMNWEEFGSIKVIIVDDDAFNRQLIASLLSKISAIVYCEAQNGEEALKILKTQSISLILLDLHMPIMDGFELLKVIKKDDKMKDIPIVIISTDELVLKDLHSSFGVKDYMVKPFRFEQLQEKIYKNIKNTHYNKNIKYTEKENHKYTLEDIQTAQIEIFKGIGIWMLLRDSSLRIVSDLVELFALILGYSKEDSKNLALCSLIYKMGALASPKSFSTFPISNVRVDIAHFEQQIQLGCAVVKKSTSTPFLEMLKGVVLYHKEHYDGSGLPNGIKGENIPVYAQIVAIIETFNLFLSQHPQKQEKLYYLFEKEAGRRFEPELIKSFLEHFELFVNEKNSYKQGDVL